MDQGFEQPMDYNFEQLVSGVTNNSHFQKLKTVVENNPYHNHQDVFSHSLEVYRTALGTIKGDFITNPDAKKLYEQFLNESIGGMRKRDILCLIALTHDIGKAAHYTEGGEQRPVVVQNPDGTTKGPGHEYVSSVLVTELLADSNLPKEIIEYMSACIRLHDTFNDSYFKTKLDLPVPLVVEDVKARAEGVYKEALFNIYCDNHAAELSHQSQVMIEKIFNEPSLYTSRSYTLS